MTGRLIAVVGPSGVGKDSVMAEMQAQAPWLALQRRAITRAPEAGGEAGGEDFEPLTIAAFTARARAGGFCLHWRAHGLHYGIPAEALAGVKSGQTLLVNLSRSILPEAAIRFTCLTVLTLTAAPATLAKRLAHRGRETAQDIAARLARDGACIPDGLHMITIANDGPLAETAAAALAALHPLKA